VATKRAGILLDALFDAMNLPVAEDATLACSVACYLVEQCKGRVMTPKMLSVLMKFSTEVLSGTASVFTGIDVSEGEGAAGGAIKRNKNANEAEKHLSKSAVVQELVSQVLETLSEVVVVVGKDFAAKFVALWPHFVVLINSNPGNEVRSALLGLVGRTAAELGAAIVPVLPVLKQLCLDSSKLGATLVTHNNAFAIGMIVTTEANPAAAFNLEALKVLEGYLAPKSSTRTDLAIVDNSVASLFRLVVVMKAAFPRRDLLLRMLAWLPLRVDDVEVQTVLNALLKGLEERWDLFEGAEVTAALLAALLRIHGVSGDAKGIAKMTGDQHNKVDTALRGYIARLSPAALGAAVATLGAAETAQFHLVVPAADAGATTGAGASAGATAVAGSSAGVGAAVSAGSSDGASGVSASDVELSLKP